MTRALVTDVPAVLEEVARKHYIVWDNMYIDFRNCPGEMMATHEMMRNPRKWGIAS